MNFFSSFFFSDLDILKPKKVDEKVFVKRSEQQKANGKKSNRVASSRPKTAPATQTSTETGKRAPFLLYGCGVSERVLGAQRTHNVRSSTAVTSLIINYDLGLYKYFIFFLVTV